MNRILIAFFIAASFFTPLSAQAQPEQEVPTLMKRDWEPIPQPQTEWIKKAPEQPSLGPRPSQVQQQDGRISPEQKEYSPRLRILQPQYGVNPKLGENSEETPVAETSPTNLPTGDFAELRQMETSSAEQVIDPLRIRLRGGKIVQLSSIEIPDMDPYDPGPLSVAARDYLSTLLKNTQVRLYQTKDAKTGRVNRMGYALGHLVIPGEQEVWIQGSLLAEGLARVQPSARNPEMAQQMIALEQAARDASKGLWADPRYAVLTPETAGQALNGWGIVEGKIRNVAMNQNIVYLNFDQDWRTDFTIVISADVRRDLNDMNINPMDLAGRIVRVRGWIEDYNGPSIKLSNATWLEVRPEPTADSPAPEAVTPAPQDAGAAAPEITAVPSTP